MVPKKGLAYRDNQIVSHSHYREPIDQSQNRLAGQSRIWGDASLETQARLVDSIIQHLQKDGFSKAQICYALALCRVESGFNPDAAAGTTSASGLGQFIDSTRATLTRRAGIENTGPFSLDVNLACLSEALQKSFAFCRRDFGQNQNAAFFETAYAYHHGGPSLSYGGMSIARQKITPLMKTIEKALGE